MMLSLMSGTLSAYRSTGIGSFTAMHETVMNTVNLDPGYLFFKMQAIGYHGS